MLNLPPKGPNSFSGRFGVGGLLLAIVIVLLLVNSVFVVSPSEEAGTRWLGGTPMTTAPLTTGVHFKVPFFESVDRLQTSRSVYTLNGLDVYTNDNQKVTIDVSLIYQIPSSAVMNLLYHIGRAGAVDIEATVLPVVRDRALAAFAQYNTLTISDQRAQITQQMRKDISEALSRLFGVDVIDVQLVGIHYSPIFDQSIEEAVRAKNLVVQAENTVAQKKFEGEQKTVTASAEAAAAVERANGEAQATVLQAQAQAKAIDTVGEALKGNPEYAHFYGLQHWNGSLPQVVGAGSIPMIDLSKGQDAGK
ncbi:prohibitin family protein [Dyella acidiphila]|uniref:Prohibitin family protein n=1 Tax=Dyella acidiphila TaxID=2775866 RepID=A0ABR9G733_9GAMM|nr:prohibitin family protein [Dyella acidiphila]MBE1159854.1 prohibitin family protein [Dyella acidiphila]